MNKQSKPCANPQHGRMTTASGWALCVNPEHHNEPEYERLGPVWHPTEVFPVGGDKTP